MREGVRSLLAKVRNGETLEPAVPMDDDYDLDADIRAAETAARDLMRKMGIPIR